MIRKVLGVLSVFNLFLVLVLPVFTDLTYLKFVLPYFISSLFGVIILLIGFKFLLTYFLIFGFFAASAIFLNTFFSYEIIFGLVLGIISSSFFYFFTEADTYE